MLTEKVKLKRKRLREKYKDFGKNPNPEVEKNIHDDVMKRIYRGLDIGELKAFLGKWIRPFDESAMEEFMKDLERCFK